ncbi:MAG: hypothetical protein HWD59_14530 [Coxiellaceae bacterium]|nr:MAG: hypothetical protein HWD59_14530 [Coxiellaceae bacterium]
MACYGAKGAENFQIPGHLENQLEINHFIYNYLICGKDSAALKEEDIKRFAEIKVFEATKQCLVHLMGFYGNSVLLQRLEKFPELLEQKDFSKIQS